MKTPLNETQENCDEFFDYMLKFEEVISVGVDFETNKFDISLKKGTNKNDFIKKCDLYDVSKINFFVL